MSIPLQNTVYSRVVEFPTGLVKEDAEKPPRPAPEHPATCAKRSADLRGGATLSKVAVDSTASTCTKSKVRPGMLVECERYVCFEEGVVTIMFYM